MRDVRRTYGSEIEGLNHNGTPHLDVICAEILQNDGSIIRVRSVQEAAQARKSHVLSHAVILRDKSSVATSPKASRSVPANSLLKT